MCVCVCERERERERVEVEHLTASPEAVGSNLTLGLAFYNFSLNHVNRGVGY